MYVSAHMEVTIIAFVSGPVRGKTLSKYHRNTMYYPWQRSRSTSESHVLWQLRPEIVNKIKSELIKDCFVLTSFFSISVSFFSPSLFLKLRNIQTRNTVNFGKISFFF
jgi:hypothetical protein